MTEPFRQESRLLVVLYEGHDLCCPQQGEVCLKFVRSGNKVIQLCWPLNCNPTHESVEGMHSGTEKVGLFYIDHER